jgi:hypothetical protein
LNGKPNDHWLSRPETLRKLWVVFAALLAASVLAELGAGIKGYFVLDDWFGFAAVFGFVTCVGMVLFARLLGAFLKRADHYYDD